MRKERLSAILLLCSLLLCLASCGGAPAASPPLPTRPLVSAIRWDFGMGLLERGGTTRGFWGTLKAEEKSGMTTKEMLEVWEWDGSAPKKTSRVEMPALLSTTVLPNDLFLSRVCGEDTDVRWPLTLESYATKEVLKTFELPTGSSVRWTGTSGNGKFVAVLLMENNMAGMRVGILEVAEKDLRWVGKVGDVLSGDLRGVTASNDGQYVALAGWKNKMALVDALAGATLWVERPPNTGSLGYGAFSSDGTILYGGDSSGAQVFAFETRTGKVLRRWIASETGGDIYGQRISCMAVSPDDKWIAVGTNPEGLVFVFDTASEGKPIMVRGGGTMIVSFSPDSRYLATVGGGVMVWDIGGPVLEGCRMQGQT